MGTVYAVTGIVLFVCVIGVVGYRIADHMDKKYGTDMKANRL